MIRLSTRLSLLALALVAVLGFSSAATAGLIVTYNDGSGLGTGAFSYKVELGAKTRIVNAANAASATIEANKASFFTIFDFAGYAGSYSVPANWTVTTQLVGNNAPNANTPTDDPTIPNLIVTYTGPTVINTGSTAIGLGTFTFNSLYTAENTEGSFYVGHANNSHATTAGLFKVSDGVTSTTVPAAVPLPAASWMGLALLGVMGAVYGFRRNREQA